MEDQNGEKLLYECDCFRILRYEDEEGNHNVALSLFNHGLDVYMTDDEFGHLVEVLGGLEHLYSQTVVRH